MGENELKTIYLRTFDRIKNKNHINFCIFAIYSDIFKSCSLFLTVMKMNEIVFWLCTLINQRILLKKNFYVLSLMHVL